MHIINVGPYKVGPGQPMLLLAGPCVLEGYEHSLAIGQEVKRICEKLGMPYVFKASFDKANRSSYDSFRGPGLEEGLKQLKGQFLAPWDMKNVISKLEAAGNHDILLTERGSSFGYNTLVTDMRGLAIMRELGYPVVMDATHSVQIPGGKGTSSGGQSQYVPHMARAAAAVGVDALFLEVHDDPSKALSDGPNMVRLDQLEALLTDVLAIDKIVRK